MGCSRLNLHLCRFLHVTNNASCNCGFHLESPKHYFIDCPLFAVPRVDLRNSIENFTAFNINTVLFGMKDLSIDQNKLICEAVHKFILETKRFDP